MIKIPFMKEISRELFTISCNKFDKNNKIDVSTELFLYSLKRSDKETEHQRHPQYLK